MWGSAPTDSTYVAVYSYYVAVAEVGEETVNGE